MSLKTFKIGKKRAVFSLRKKGGSVIPPKYKQRTVSAIRDFPPGCGRSTEENQLFEVVRTPEPLFVRGFNSVSEPSIGEKSQVEVLRKSEGKFLDRYS